MDAACVTGSMENIQCGGVVDGDSSSGVGCKMFSYNCADEPERPNALQESRVTLLR